MNHAHRTITAAAATTAMAATASAQFLGFAPRTDIDIGPSASPTESASADLDNDGDNDIAVPVFTDGNLDAVAVLINNGDGTFATPAFYPVGSEPTDITAADFDADGDTDVATANRGTNDVSVLLNEGDATFAPENFFSVGNAPEGLDAADLDNDGAIDIINTNSNDDSVTIHFGDNSGDNWTDGPVLNTNDANGDQGDNPEATLVTDLNKDGLPDIVTVNAGSARCTVFYNDPSNPGQNYFSLGFFVLTGGQNPQDVAAADTDRDGDLDLAIVNRGSDTLAIRYSDFNSGANAFPTFSGGPTLATPDAPIGVAAADLDDPPARGDADPDIIVSAEGDDELRVYLNDGAGGFSLGPALNTAASPEQPIAADLDNDADIDIAVPNLNDDSVSIFLNRSTVIGADPPTVQINSPEDNAAICEGGDPILGGNPIEATITPATGTTIDKYTVKARALGGSFTTIATGSSPINNDTAAIWNTNGLQEGRYLVKVTATTAGGSSASDEILVRLSTDFDIVNAGFAAGFDQNGNPQQADIVGANACVRGTVNDFLAKQPIEYTVEYNQGVTFVPIDPNNPVYSGERLNEPLATWDTVGQGIPDGEYTVRIEATNGCATGIGGSGTASQDITVTVDNTSPVAQIDSPQSCRNITPGDTVTVTGTASDANIDGWSLQYTDPNSAGWTTIASGNTSINNSTIAAWDTSGLQQCAYTLRLVVTDRSVRNCRNIGARSVALTSVDLRCQSDTDASGVTDLDDLLAVLSEFGTSCP